MDEQEQGRADGSCGEHRLQRTRQPPSAFWTSQQHSLSLSRTHVFHAPTFWLSQQHSLSITHTLSLCFPLSLSHTHIHKHTPTHTLSLSLVLPASLSLRGADRSSGEHRLKRPRQPPSATFWPSQGYSRFVPVCSILSLSRFGPVSSILSLSHTHTLSFSLSRSLSLSHSHTHTNLDGQMAAAVSTV